ncbi:SAM-dependent methyltransferase [Rubrimonas cliftonensis]|uniref:Methyltransferase domain-containing protein n=1 Tax=Rubrimonas cliftonensis TaxID=89524 RepID=A0A1H3X6B2_9RHOB|nr:class I SAM-dependent methyltransferase [Rubrimonas cliftonensis]SDZ94813.1 Methyltransferase domain-containing protein [Rubrimonas cliftonensis]
MTDEAVAALIALHACAPREGPGDVATLERMIAALGFAPYAGPTRAADLGCGSGATALHLAEAYGADVLAVDFAEPFVARLAERLAEAPPARGAVSPHRGDMLAPPVAPGALDLIVSEGAAYNVGFATAMKAWRPLVRAGGGLVVSECVWFGARRPPEAAAFWAEAYPEMGSISDAVAKAEAGGWRLKAAERLAPEVWWTSYYDPLAARCDALEPGADGVLKAVIAETRAEMALFRATSADWGYVYLALDAD